MSDWGCACKSDHRKFAAKVRDGGMELVMICDSCGKETPVYAQHPVRAGDAVFATSVMRKHQEYHEKEMRYIQYQKDLLASRTFWSHEYGTMTTGAHFGKSVLRRLEDGVWQVVRWTPTVAEVEMCLAEVAA